jgi:hypothetical protein
MWNWFNCYLSGRHDYGMWCEPGAIFLRCVHCGRRSSGWTIGAEPNAHTHAAAPTTSPAVRPRVLEPATVPANSARVVPFKRTVAAS